MVRRQDKKADILILEFSRDESEAFLTINKPRSAPPIKKDYVIDFLTERGIVESIDHEALEHLLNEPGPREKVCIARGKKVVLSRKGAVIYPCLPSKNQDICSAEPVDHREINGIVAISKGEVVAQLRGALTSSADSC